MARVELRRWQKEALALWLSNNQRGILSVVTGGGKTVFALECIAETRPETTLVVVPTLALLDQWWEAACSYFNLRVDEVCVLSGRRRLCAGTINLAVLNTAAKLGAESLPCFLIVDECHKAASEHFRELLKLRTVASLGLSATPERPYDEGLTEVLVPALGPILYEYSYRDALRDGVIVPFKLRNIVFELEEERQTEYDRLTRSIARSIQRNGIEAEDTVTLLLRRARVLNLSLNRVRLSLRLVARYRGRRILVFHEDIEACGLIHEVLADNGVRAGLYHSRIPLKQRVKTLAEYRKGSLEVLVTCRALDEGFDVPETDVGIIAASTATRRQRIQRLGRVLRPASGKEGAEVFTLVATTPEIARLKEEEAELEGVAEVTWGRA